MQSLLFKLLVILGVNKVLIFSGRYGMIYSSGDVEMQPLDKEDDEEDDMTVFDRKIRK